MHRVRQNLNYLADFGWEATVIAVDERFVETGQDSYLNLSIPPEIKVHKVKAFSSTWTRKIGLGALALRSLFYFFLKGNQILNSSKFDLVFFSTTQFPVLILGRYWKWRFKLPYIIDMQDPWHSDFYKNKPKNERPPKYWFSYRLNKFLEPIAMKKADGIIAVSEGYCTQLQECYANISPEKCIVIPFGAFEKDFEIATKLSAESKIKNQNSELQITYIGRGGADMSVAINIIFRAFKIGLERNFSLFSKVKFSFLGTSYAKSGQGKKTIAPLATEFGIDEYVTEITDRLPYFESLARLSQSDILLIPGSTDPNYTASKIYPYILAKKPILAVFSNTSSVIDVLLATKAGSYVGFDSLNVDFEKSAISFSELFEQTLSAIPFVPNTNWAAFEPYTAKEMTRKQVDFFNKILKND